MTSVYVAAGSNVEPVRNLRIALDVLNGHFAPMRVSRAYQNAAVGFAGEDFINLVVGFETDHSLQAVMDRLHDAEAACGRERHAPKWAPRSMDLDILLFGDEVREEPGLKLPRPDLARRPYMLGPAAEIAPDVVHPTLQQTLAELWRAMRASQSHEMRVVDLGWQPDAAAAGE